MSHEPPGDTVSEPDPGRPGSVLRAEREALGVTVREVAETLNLSMTMVEAIEADDLDRLPGLVFARGYVRAYARLLELDPEPLMERYPKINVDPARTEAPTEPPLWEWIRRRPGLVIGGALALVVLMLVLLVTWLWPDGEPAPETAQAQTPSGRPAIPAAPTDADSATLVPGGVAGTAAVGGSAPTESSGSGPAAGTLTAETAAGETRAVPAQTGAGGDEADSVRRITPTGEDRLAFRFGNDCWVEVRRAGDTNENLYSDLRRGGTSLELVGQGPFWIRLGDAPSTDLVYNGEPVPLAPHTRNNVATLVLGQ